MRLIDTHCHPQMADYDTDREAMIRRALDAGIGLIAIGTTLDDSLAGVRLAEQYPEEPVYAAIGVHPTDGDVGDTNPSSLRAMLGSKKIVAIGETGLDYFRLADDDGESRDMQSDAFEAQILLAKEAALPLVVHCRDKNGSTEAYDNCATLLRRHNVQKFVMHCFGATLAEAKMFLDLGGMISLTGVITFPKSDNLREVACQTPPDRLMVETDAPFLAPAPHRGKRNEPAWVQLVAEEIAKIRGVAFDELAHATTENAKKSFGLS